MSLDEDEENAEVEIDLTHLSQAEAIDILGNPQPGSGAGILATLLAQIRSDAAAAAAAQPEGCAFTGASTQGRATVTLGAKVYDALFLADYVLQTRDHRAPNGLALSASDLLTLGDALEVPTHEDTRERLLLAKPAEVLPASPVTSATAFCEDTIALLGLQVLAVCELAGISSLGDVQVQFRSMWGSLVRCFSGLLSYQPLRAAHAALALKAVFAEASASCESADAYFYEPSALLPINASVSALCATVTAAVLRSNLREGLLQLQAVRPATIT